MKSLKIFFLCVFLGGITFYNSNWFQSLFLSDHFYEGIYDAPFDVTQKGESISIPIKYKYRTCYGLKITVPDKDLFHSRTLGPGVLAYRFTSRGRVLAEGHTFQPSRHHLMYYRGITSVQILVFNLPFPGEGDGLVLELKVIEPMKFLMPYVGTIHCKISPNYDAKLGSCDSEAMRVEDSPR